MIVKKMKQQKSFKKSAAKHGTDLIKYILTARSADAEKKELLICAGTFNCDNTENVNSIIAENIGLAAENSRIANPFVHYVLSVSEEENEKINSDTAPEMVKTFAREMGISELNITWGVHDDKDNRHIHICVNRVHPVTGQRVDIAGRRDIEAAHAAISVVEHEHGLRPEKNATHIYDLEKKTSVKNPEHSRGVSDRGREEEQRTGKESAERQILALAPIIAAAKTWKELHEELAKQNAHYEKSARGGATIRIGKTRLKASTVDRNASLNQLEKKLGKFQEAEKGIEQQQQHENQFAEKGVSFLILLLAAIFIAIGFHRHALVLLKDAYDKTRKDIEKKGWKGKGKQLNALRSAHAAEYRDQKTAAKRTFKEKVKELRKLDEKSLVTFVKENALDEDQRQYALRYEREKLQETKEMTSTKTFNDAVTKDEREKYLSDFLKIDNVLHADTYHFTSKLDAAAPGMTDEQIKNSTFTFGKKYAVQNIPEKISKTGAFIGWTREEAIAQYDQMIRKNREQDRGTYIMPISDSVHYVLIDDIKTDEQKKLVKTFANAVILESSPGNFQAILKIHAHADQEIAKEAANRLAREINQLCGDPKIVKCAQAWRMPGFENHKPKHFKDGEFPTVKLHYAKDIFCDKAQAMYDKHVEELLKMRELAKDATQKRRDAKDAKIYTTPAAIIEAAAAPAAAAEIYRLHATDILKKKPATPGRTLDYFVAQRLLATGHAENEAVAILIAGAPQFRPDTDHDFSNSAYASAVITDAAKGKEDFSKSYGGIVRLWRNFEKQIIEQNRSAEEVLKRHARSQSMSR